MLPPSSDREAWQLDDVGNWETRKIGTAPEDTFAVNALNQYTEIDPEGAGAQMFSFDWLGQMRVNESRNQRYVWDGFGRLTRVRNDATGSVIAEYRYDAFNRRVEKHVPSPSYATDQTTRFVYDGWRAIEERAVLALPTENEVVRARYGFGLDLDELLWMDRDVPRTGGRRIRSSASRTGPSRRATSCITTRRAAPLR